MTILLGIFYEKNRTFHKKKVWVVFLVCSVMLLGLMCRLVWLMGFRSDYYYEKAQDLHERERDIKAARGKILDAKGKVLADNKTVCTVSVIHSQIKEPEKVIRLLVSELGITEAEARKKVEKVSSIETDQDKCRQRNRRCHPPGRTFWGKGGRGL